MSPFTVIGTASDNFDEYLLIQFTCSQNLDSFVNFQNNLLDICNGLTFRGRISDINSFFNKLSVTLKAYPETPQSVTFLLTNSKKQELFSLTQTLAFIGKLNLIEALNVYVFDVNDSGAANKMAIIDSSPFSENFSPEFAIVEDTYTPYLESFLSGDLVFFQIQSGLSFIAMSNYKFHVVEKKTGLVSDEVNFKVETKSSPAIFINAVQESPKSSKFSLLKFSFFFIVAIALIYFFVFYKRQTHSNVQQTKTSLEVMKIIRTDDIQQNSFEIKGNVLSDSVITWNHNLMAKHSTKTAKTVEENVLVSQDDISVLVQEGTSQILDAISPEHFEDISIIGSERRQTGGVLNGNNSMFLDGFNL